MLVRDLHPETGSGTAWHRDDLEVQLADTFAHAPETAVLRLRIHGTIPLDARAALAASHLRRLAPPEMNIEAIVVEDRSNQRLARGRASLRKGSGPQLVLDHDHGRLSTPDLFCEEVTTSDR
jgi:hypothetical protein